MITSVKTERIHSIPVTYDMLAGAPRIPPLDPPEGYVIPARPAWENPQVIRFRQPPALAIAGLLTTIGALPLLVGSLFFLVVPLATAVFAIWAWRAGTDASPAGLHVRALMGSADIPWSRVETLMPEQRKVVATLTGGGHVTLTAVRPEDLPKLVEASGSQLSPAQ
jgi:Bacterial PH domain